MRIKSEGYPFIASMLLLTLIIYYLMDVKAAVIPFVFAIYFTYFFRHPYRKVVQDETCFYSPADGTVTGIDYIYDTEYLDAKAVRVTIFLSVFDVHVNRSPISGTIKYRSYTCGHYLPAFDNKAAFENERHAIGINNGDIKILVIQIAGILARRIVSYVDIGYELKQGECYGMIKFGSCTQLIMPVNVQIKVKKGDKVKGGVSIIAKNTEE